MLFSDARIAALVRDQFDAAWESVRPVPLVEIDFGNGNKIKRTVNGNIATYVCAPDGRVIDVIPGLNTPQAFLEDLAYALNLWRASQTSFDATVLEYHRVNLSTPTVYAWVRLDSGKAAVEKLMRMSLDKRQAIVDAGGSEHRPRPLPDRLKTDPSKVEGEFPIGSLNAEEIAILAADTEINRKERKPAVHRILSETIVRPGDITRRVYREVLHCDLDDPYLGLISGAFRGGAYEHR